VCVRACVGGGTSQFICLLDKKKKENVKIKAGFQFHNVRKDFPSLSYFRMSHTYATLYWSN